MNKSITVVLSIAVFFTILHAHLGLKMPVPGLYLFNYHFLNMDANQKIHECILNINVRVVNIQEVKLASKALNLPSGHPIDADMKFLGIVKICTIFDELKILNSLCKGNTYLQTVFYCLQPILGYLKQYEKGCMNIRNNGIAHFQRDKLGKFKPLAPLLANLHIPRDNKEWEFIYDCLDVLRVFLLQAFPDFPKFHAEKAVEMAGGITAFANAFQQKEAMDIEALKSEFNRRMVERNFLMPGEDFIQKFRSQE